MLLASADKFFAGFQPGFALSLLRSCDSSVDIGHRTAQHGATESGHGRVDRVGALLGNHGQQRGSPDPDRTGDPGQRGLRLTGVVNIKQSAGVEAASAADEHPERSADDSDQQSDDTSTGRAEHERRFGPVRFDDLPVVATHDDDGLFDDDPPLRVKLLEQRHRRLGVAIVVE